MRKLFLLFVALVTTTALLAHDFYSEGIYYNRIGNNCVEVTHPTNRIHDYSGSVVIPNEVYYSGTTYSVTTIGKNAFEFCSLTDITLPNSLTVIKDSAFFHCYCDSILIPNGVTTIESYAFYGSDFSSITIGDSVTSIGEWAFSSSSYTSITIPKSVTNINNNAFAGCTSLHTAVLTNRDLVLEGHVFQNCPQLQDAGPLTAPIDGKYRYDFNYAWDTEIPAMIMV